MTKRAGLVAVALFVVVGCAQPIPSSPPPELPDGPAIPAEDLAEAIRFRTSFGLRADTGYIEAVAADPASDAGRDIFGVPLTPDELADLERRQRQADAAISTIVEYGEGHRGSFGEVRIDQQRGGILVVGMVGDPTVHQAALRQLLGPDPLFEVVPIEYSLAQLDAFREQIHTEGDAWMAAIPARMIALGSDPFAGHVSMGVSSPHPDAVALIQAHYGDPAWLQVESDGTGKELLPSGGVEVVVTRADGRPAVGVRCTFVPDWDGDPTSAFADDDGVCRIELAASGYWVRIFDAGGSETVLAITRTVVVAGEATEVVVGLGDR